MLGAGDSLALRRRSKEGRNVTDSTGYDTSELTFEELTALVSTSYATRADRKAWKEIAKRRFEYENAEKRRQYIDKIRKAPK